MAVGASPRPFHFPSEGIEPSRGHPACGFFVCVHKDGTQWDTVIMQSTIST